MNQDLTPLSRKLRQSAPDIGLTRRGVMLGGLATALAGGAFAQAYPSRPIRWIVGAAAGAASDHLARTVGQGLGSQLGQTIVVDNRGGASGMIAGEAAARAEADGYTLWTGDNGTLINNFELLPKVPYRREDFAPIGMMGRVPILIVASPKAPYSSAVQFVDTMRKKPGGVNYATPGIGTPHNLAMEMLNHRNNLKGTPVHYRGGAPALQDLLAEQIHVMSLDVASALPYLRQGRIRALGIFTKNRHVDLPDVPSLFEQGLIDVEAVAWQGLFGQAALPDAIKSKLVTSFQAAMKLPQVTTPLREVGWEIMASTPEETQRVIENDYGYWVKLIRDRNIVAT